MVILHNVQDDDDDDDDDSRCFRGQFSSQPGHQMFSISNQVENKKK